MKLVIIANVAPFAIGGAEQQAMRLGRAWTRSGHSVYFLTIHAFPDDHAIHEWATVVSLRGSRYRWLRALRYVVAVSIVLARMRREIDCVYCRILGEAAIVASLVRFLGLLRCPIVACAAADGPDGDMAKLEHLPCRRVILRLLNRQLSAVNAFSESLRVSLRNAGILLPAFTQIPNGVDGQFFAVGPRDRPIRKLLFVGRLVESKGVVELVEAFSTMPSDRSASLTVVGEGPLEPALRSIADSSEHPNRIVFVGLRHPREMPATYAAHDALILWSSSEGQPGVALEAAATGMPVVVSHYVGERLPEFPSLIRETPQDRATACRILQRLMATPLPAVNENAAVVRQWASRHRLDEIADEYLVLFSRLVAEAR